MKQEVRIFADHEVSIEEEIKKYLEKGWKVSDIQISTNTVHPEISGTGIGGQYVVVAAVVFEIDEKTQIRSGEL